MPIRMRFSRNIHVIWRVSQELPHRLVDDQNASGLPNRQPIIVQNVDKFHNPRPNISLDHIEPIAWEPVNNFSGILRNSQRVQTPLQRTNRTDLYAASISILKLMVISNRCAIQRHSSLVLIERKSRFMEAVAPDRYLSSADFLNNSMASAGRKPLT